MSDRSEYQARQAASVAADDAIAKAAGVTACKVIERPAAVGFPLVDLSLAGDISPSVANLPGVHVVGLAEVVVRGGALVLGAAGPAVAVGSVPAIVVVTGSTFKAGSA